MMRTGLGLLGCPRESALIVGDRMDTDIISGIESGIETVLVLSGVAKREDLGRFGFGPDYILDHIGQLPALLDAAQS
jgi:NagD protein